MIEDEGLNSEHFSRNRKEGVDLNFSNMKLRKRNYLSVIPISSAWVMGWLVMPFLKWGTKEEGNILGKNVKSSLTQGV